MADNLATPILSSAKMNPWNPPQHNSLGNQWQSIRIHLGTHLGNSCLLSAYPVPGIGLGAGLEQQTKQNTLVLRQGSCDEVGIQYERYFHP